MFIFDLSEVIHKLLQVDMQYINETFQLKIFIWDIHILSQTSQKAPQE